MYRCLKDHKAYNEATYLFALQKRKNKNQITSLGEKVVCPTQSVWVANQVVRRVCLIVQKGQ
jgi:hypothetical protein